MVHDWALIHLCLGGLKWRIDLLIPGILISLRPVVSLLSNAFACFSGIAGLMHDFRSKAWLGFVLVRSAAQILPLVGDSSIFSCIGLDHGYWRVMMQRWQWTAQFRG